MFLFEEFFYRSIAVFNVKRNRYFCWGGNSISNVCLNCLLGAFSRRKNSLSEGVISVPREANSYPLKLTFVQNGFCGKECKQEVTKIGFPSGGGI